MKANISPKAKKQNEAKTDPTILGTILIVDDNAINRLLLNIAFKESPYKLIDATDGKDALKKLKANNTIDIILLDLNMPFMDGYDFLNYINQSPTLKNLPLQVIVVTASRLTDFNATIAKRNICTNRMAKFFTKPLELSEIKKLVDQLIKMKHNKTEEQH
jgi:CheY-like chemotaxis protein